MALSFSPDLGRCRPASTTLVASLLLSLDAAQRGTINRDGMLYIETTRSFIEGGSTPRWSPSNGHSCRS